MCRMGGSIESPELQGDGAGAEQGRGLLPPVPCWWKNQGPMPVAVWERGVEHWGSELAWPDPEDPWQTMNCDTSSTV